MRKLVLPPRRVRHITNRMRMFRAAKGWSQDELARRLGYDSKFRVWQLENSEALPRPKERKKLAKLLGCSARDLFPLIAA